MNVKTLIRDALLIVMVIALVACSADRTKVIRMGAVPAAYYLPIFVVQEKGFLKTRGYESRVEVFSANTNMMDAFLTGNLEIAAQSSGTLFPLESRQPNRFRFIYGQNNKSYSFIVAENSEIQSLKDLEGKKVATWPSPTAQLAIQLSVKPFFDPSKVAIQPVEFKLLNQVLFQKEVEAVFNTDVFTAQAIRSGKARYLEQLPLPKYVMDPFFNGGGFINPKLITEDPKMAKAIKEAFDEAIQYINEHNEEARLLIAKPEYVPAEKEDILAAPLDEYISVEQVNIEQAQRLADIFLEKNMLAKKIDVSKLF